MRPAVKQPALALRDAEEHDLPAIQAIYAHHVETGLGSFEETAPGISEMIRRYHAIRERGMPYLVAVLDGAVRGFAYVATYRPRSAYRHTVENSIYVDPEWHGKGIAAALLAALIERCTEAGYRQMVAVIGDSGNRASVALHERLGFRQVGTLKSVGRKHGRWVDTVLMQRTLGAGDRPLED
jgi:L-amino acid N-acyltransferase YncA